jgi:hypothetical protein
MKANERDIRVTGLMKRLLLAGLLALVLTGCAADKYQYGCGGGSACTLSTSGTPTVDMSDQLGPGAVVAIKDVGDHSVTLTVDGAGATLNSGQSKQVGRLKITVESVKDDDVKLHVEEA